MFEKPKLNANEAPLGFYAVDKKEAKTSNVCDSCDARQLCQENKNDWCLENRCMAYEVIAFKDGNVYKRKDNCSVFFKTQKQNYGTNNLQNATRIERL